MPEPENWILIRVKANQILKFPKEKQKHLKTAIFLANRFKDSIMNSLLYAFISAPLIELPVKMAIKKGEEDLERTFINVVKRRYAEDLVMETFHKGGLGVSALL